MFKKEAEDLALSFIPVINEQVINGIPFNLTDLFGAEIYLGNDYIYAYAEFN